MSDNFKNEQYNLQFPGQPIVQIQPICNMNNVGCDYTDYNRGYGNNIINNNFTTSNTLELDCNYRGAGNRFYSVLPTPSPQILSNFQALNSSNCNNYNNYNYNENVFNPPDSNLCLIQNINNNNGCCSNSCCGLGLQSNNENEQNIKFEIDQFNPFQNMSSNNNNNLQLSATPTSTTACAMDDIQPLYDDQMYYTDNTQCNINAFQDIDDVQQQHEEDYHGDNKSNPSSSSYDSGLYSQIWSSSNSEQNSNSNHVILGANPASGFITGSILKTDNEKQVIPNLATVASNTSSSSAVSSSVPDKQGNKLDHQYGAIRFRPSDRSKYLNMNGRYECNICSRSYARYNDLRGHFVIHNPSTPSCPYCGKKFSRPIYLRDHIRSHRGEKPFKCDICSRSFTAKRNLTHHLKSHLGINQNFSCRICKKPFQNNKDLKIHLKKHE